MKRKYFLVGSLIVLATVLVTLALYPHLPDRLPVHWNIHGRVDRYGSKWTLLFPIPGLMTGLMVIMAALPWLSPRNFEVDGPRPVYLQIMLIMLPFMAYIHFLLLGSAMGVPIRIPRAVVGEVCTMVAAVGPLLSHVRRNFFVGVRTPWTLADERVWHATHHFASGAFLWAGLAGWVLIFLGLDVWLPVVTVAAGALACVLYSLAYYKQLERRGEL